MAIGSIRSLAYGRHAPFSAFANTPAHYSTASQDLMYGSPHAVVSQPALPVQCLPVTEQCRSGACIHSTLAHKVLQCGDYVVVIGVIPRTTRAR